MNVPISPPLRALSIVVPVDNESVTIHVTLEPPYLSRRPENRLARRHTRHRLHPQIPFRVLSL